MVMTVNIIVFVVACMVSLRSTPWTAFATVFVPALLFLSAVQGLPIPYFTNVNPPVAAAYGICVGLLLHGKPQFALRWNLVDTLVLSYTIAGMISAVMTEAGYTSIIQMKMELEGWVLPYLLARVAFHSVIAQRQCLHVLLSAMPVIALCGLVECRLRPRFYLHMLDTLGVVDWWGSEAIATRYGLFRTTGTVAHPIYFGNLCVVVFGLIAMLAARRPKGINVFAVWAALLSTATGILVSLSFSAWNALFMACLAFTLTNWFGWLRRHLIVLVLAGIVAGVLVGQVMLSTDAAANEHDSPEEVSLKNRALIVQNAWRVLSTTGWWGKGRFFDASELKLESTHNSVDNAYLLIGIIRGWISLLIWLMIPLALAWHVSKAMQHRITTADCVSLQIGFATVCGILVAMYTVWLDISYTVPWLLLVGFTVTLTDIVLAATPQAIGSPRPVATPAFVQTSHPQATRP